MYRVSEEAKLSALEVGIPESVFNRLEDARHFASESAVKAYLFEVLEEKQRKKYEAKLVESLRDPWAIRALNAMTVGSRIQVERTLFVLRVPGGFMYEYVNKDNIVTTCAFVSTDEFRNA